jgi:hypothetical protein
VALHHSGGRRDTVGNDTPTRGVDEVRRVLYFGDPNNNNNNNNKQNTRQPSSKLREH